MTRPAEQGDRFAEALRGRFGPAFDIVMSPVLVTRFLAPVLPEAMPSGVIFTSEAGVQGLGRIAALGPMRAWCVGARTAAAARRAGFDAIDGGGDAGALVRTILASGARGPLLYARGRDRAVDIAGGLEMAGTETIEAVVYAQDAQPLSQQASALFAGTVPVIAPLFSARTATFLAAEIAVTNRTAPLWVAALSTNILVAAEVTHPDRTAVSARPDTASLLDAIEELLQSNRQP